MKREPVKLPFEEDDYTNSQDREEVIKKIELFRENMELLVGKGISPDEQAGTRLFFAEMKLKYGGNR